MKFPSKLPSEIFGGLDEYTAYCFNEAIAYILQMLKEGNKPVFKKKVKSFHEMYSSYNGGETQCQ